MSKKIKKKKSSKNQNRKDLPLKNLEEISNKDSFVFYGRSGTGKTTLAGTFPGPILFMDIKDRGTDSLDAEEFDGKIMEVNSWDDYELTYWWLKKKKNRRQFGTVVLDTVSQLQLLAVIKVLEDKGKSTEDAGHWGTMKRGDWGTVSSMVKSAITDMRDLPGLKVVFIAQDKTFNLGEEDEDTDQLTPEVGPGLSPASMKHLNAEVAIIGNTFIKGETIKKKIKLKGGGKKTKFIEETVYCLRIGPNPVYITKVRKPKRIELPSIIKDPDYDKIMEAIEA